MTAPHCPSALTALIDRQVRTAGVRSTALVLSSARSPWNRKTRVDECLSLDAMKLHGEGVFTGGLRRLWTQRWEIRELRKAEAPNE